MTQTVIGVFDTSDSAYGAVDTLIDQGVDKSSIFISSKEGSGAGPGLKGQPMSAIRNFLSELFGPEDSQDVDYYAKKISSGGLLLSVDVTDETDVEAISKAIEEAGALDIEALRLTQGDDESSSGAESKSQAVPVIEEQTEVGKRQVAKGKVRVVSRMVETPVREEVTLKEEHASIKRRPVDEPVNPADVDALAGETIEVEETAEVPIVTKSARIVEEVEVGKESSERVETVEDTERRTEVEIERETPQPERKGRK